MQDLTPLKAVLEDNERILVIRTGKWPLVIACNSEWHILITVPSPSIGESYEEITVKREWAKCSGHSKALINKVEEFYNDDLY